MPTADTLYQIADACVGMTADEIANEIRGSAAASSIPDPDALARYFVAISQSV